MTLMKDTSKWAAAAIAVTLLGVACGPGSERADESPTPTESADSRIDRSELTGVRVDVRRDPG